MTRTQTQTAALVGATGGAGTTRTAVELAALLAAGGDDVAVLDAAFATQGLADYLDGAVDTDATALLTDEADAPLDAGLYDLELAADAPGRVACCPASAPFERLARAKTAGAARLFEERIEGAAAAFDAVLVDVAPVAANQHAAAVTACDRVTVVAPATRRGADAVQRTRDVLDDAGAPADAVVSTGGDVAAADASLPDLPDGAAAAGTAPVCDVPSGPYAAAMVGAAAAVLGDEPDLRVEGEGVVDRLAGRVSR